MQESFTDCCIIRGFSDGKQTGHERFEEGYEELAKRVLGQFHFEKKELVVNPPMANSRFFSFKKK
jgi:hypothetical protein